MGQGERKILRHRLEHLFSLTGWHVVAIPDLTRVESVIDRRGRVLVLMPAGLADEEYVDRLGGELLLLLLGGCDAVALAALLDACACARAGVVEGSRR